VHFVENVFSYSSTLTITSFLSHIHSYMRTIIWPHTFKPHTNNSNIHITKFKFHLHCLLLTYHISKLIFTYIHANITLTSSPPHVLPNFTKSSPPSNNDILYTLGSSPSTHIDSSSCSPGPKQPSHSMVTISKDGISKPKQLHLVSKFPLSNQIEPFCLSQDLKHF